MALPIDARETRFDHVFSSCNRNFHILGERPVNRWCGVCPKCHFVFLALAPFMPKPRLMGIFGRNLLDEPEQAPGFDALLEYQDHKPFECVGEGRESRAAMAALASLRAPIDAFFDKVTVNDADPAKREARLNLLARMRDAVHKVADFSKIEG